MSKTEIKELETFSKLDSWQYNWLYVSRRRFDNRCEHPGHVLVGYVRDGAVDRLCARPHPQSGRDGPVSVQRRTGAGGQTAREASGRRHRSLHLLREHYGGQHPPPLQGIRLN